MKPIRSEQLTDAGCKHRGISCLTALLRADWHVETIARHRIRYSWHAFEQNSVSDVQKDATTAKRTRASGLKRRKTMRTVANWTDHVTSRLSCCIIREGSRDDYSSKIVQYGRIGYEHGSLQGLPSSNRSYFLRFRLVKGERHVQVAVGNAESKIRTSDTIKHR